jgi:hypothetical protein
MIALLSSDDIPQAPSSVLNERLLQAAVTHLLKRLEQLGMARDSLVQQPIPSVRNDLLQVLQELHNQHPDWQIGELVAKLAAWSGVSCYNAEDEDLLATGQQHLGRAPA